MKKQLAPIVFFGNERLATGVTTTAPTLRTLLGSGCRVSAVVVNNQPVRSRTKRGLEIAEVAKKNNIPVLSPNNLGDINRELADFKPEIGVLVAYGKIVSQEIIDIFPRGIVNIHPSLLPKHRGPAPIESVILGGDSETGVSIMQLSSRMDAGPIFAQIKVSVPNAASKQELSNKLLKSGADLLASILPDILSGTLQPVPQDETQASYDQLINKKDGIIDWSLPAETIERQIRAYAGWPKSTAKLGNYSVNITKVDVTNTTGKAGEYHISKNNLIVYCGEKSLSIKILQPAGKKEMPAGAFLAGYKL